MDVNRAPRREFQLNSVSTAAISILLTTSRICEESEPALHKQQNLSNTGTVYQITFERGGKSYIGETMRPLQRRLNEQVRALLRPLVLIHPSAFRNIAPSTTLLRAFLQLKLMYSVPLRSMNRPFPIIAKAS